MIPGGVDSPFRSFSEVGGHTIFFARAHGAYLTDVDGNRYIDYLGAWGPAILGHSPQAVVVACQETLALGPVFGAPHTLELEMARLLIKAVPSVEMVRFVNSGTEAVMSAVRLARGFTGNDKIVMFEGGYHGHSDPVLASQGHRSSGGIPKATAEHTILAEFNSEESLRDVLLQHKGQVAAVLIEPVCGSMGVVVPESDYLKKVRALCDEFGVLLIFDEVLTGFRVAYGGAQNLYGVRPDLTCFGKALGGGMPIGAFGGRRDIMEHLQPIGDVYQAGTFSGNPVTMAGGIAILKLLDNPDVYATLEKRTKQLFDGLAQVVSRRQLPVQLARAGSMFAIVFCDSPVRNFRQSKAINAEQFAHFFGKVLRQGICLPPSAVDAACVSAAHSEEDIERTVAIMTRAFE